MFNLKFRLSPIIVFSITDHFWLCGQSFLTMPWIILKSVSEHFYPVANGSWPCRQSFLTLSLLVFDCVAIILAYIKILIIWICIEKKQYLRFKLFQVTSLRLLHSLHLRLWFQSKSFQPASFKKWRQWRQWKVAEVMETHKP